MTDQELLELVDEIITNIKELNDLIKELEK